MLSSRHKSYRATETLLPGQIAYLKKRAECDEEDIDRTDISDGCFDHLVLILSIDTQNARAEALIVMLPQMRILRITEPNCYHS